MHRELRHIPQVKMDILRLVLFKPGKDALRAGDVIMRCNVLVAGSQAGGQEVLHWFHLSFCVWIPYRVAVLKMTVLQIVEQCTDGTEIVDLRANYYDVGDLALWPWVIRAPIFAFLNEWELARLLCPGREGFTVKIRFGYLLDSASPLPERTADEIRATLVGEEHDAWTDPSFLDHLVSD